MHEQRNRKKLTMYQLERLIHLQAFPELYRAGAMRGPALSQLAEQRVEYTVNMLHLTDSWKKAD